MVLNCFRVVISGRMGKQMYFMPRKNPEDEVAKKFLIFQLRDVPFTAA